MPLIFWGITALFSGAWIGSTISDATKAPSVIIQQSTSEGEEAKRKSYITYAICGLAAYVIYKWSRKR